MIEIERTFPVTEIQRVELRIGMGDVQATAGSGEVITLRAQLRSEDESDLEIAAAGGVLIVRNRATNGWNWRGPGRIDV